MTELAQEQDEQVLIRFGDAPGNALTLDTVTAVLRMWHEREPETMGAYVGEAICGARPQPRSRRTRAQ